MKPLILSLGLAATLAAGVTEAESEGDALVIGNADYGLLSFLGRGADLAELNGGLQDTGFAVTAVQDADAAQMRAAFSEFLSGMAGDRGGEGVLVVLVGQFASGPAGAHLLPVDSDDPVNEARVLTGAFPVDAALTALANRPGKAVLVLGEASGAVSETRFLTGGAGRLQIPQGVTVIRGDVAEAARFLREAVKRPSRDLLNVALMGGLDLEGFVPEALALKDLADVPAAEERTGPDIPVDEESAQRDEAAWVAATRSNTESAYSDYLSRFPEGAHAGEARQRLTAIRSEPFHREKRAEADLSLSRDARREIQRDLSLLGFDTRGIDGIFGRGSRGAISSWQERNGFAASGYLTAEQIARLDAQAERRAAELEEEARQRKEAQDARDRAFWQETGAKGDAAGLRAYLKRFPDGLFAEVAQERLDSIEQDRRASAAIRDRRAWDQAKAADTREAYEDYLSAFPKGAFVEQARQQLDAPDKDAARQETIARAKREEQQLNLSPIVRRLAETRLQGLGLKPGKVDGIFDKNTRRALRRYQNARELSVTGYLDQATAVRLMADTILR